MAFFHDRLKVSLRDAGARYDLVDAVLSEDSDDILQITQRVDALCIGQHIGAGVGQSDAPADALEDSRAERVLEELDLARDSGLGQVQLVGSAASFRAGLPNAATRGKRHGQIMTSTHWEHSWNYFCRKLAAQGESADGSPMPLFG